jgi:hypothetical protein
MINRLIILLLCLKLRIKPFDMFQFDNQKSKHDKYYFTKRNLMKLRYDEKKGHYVETVYSNVSLNWLLNSQCKIIKVK